MKYTPNITEIDIAKAFVDEKYRRSVLNCTEDNFIDINKRNNVRFVKMADIYQSYKELY